MEPLYRLARETRDQLRRTHFRSAPDRRLAQDFANDLDRVVAQDLPRQRPRARAVRALRHVPGLLASAAPSGIDKLARAARAAFDLVNWSEFYAADDWSSSFLPEFANGEGIGPDGRLQHASLILGLFVLGPETLYPAHAHPAEEFYIVLSGRPEFQVGAGSRFVRHRPGSIVLHHAEVSHAIRTGSEPFFGVFGWRGAIEAGSWYRDDMTDPAAPKRYPQIHKD